MSQNRAYCRASLLAEKHQTIESLVGKVDEWQMEQDEEGVLYYPEDGEGKFRIVRAWINIDYAPEFQEGYVFVDTEPI